MSLKFNGVDITRVFINGVEQKTLEFNGVSYFGKQYSLTRNTSNNVILTVFRTSSPNEHAPIGNVNTGNTIYYGDAITISATASTHYINPKLYVDIGDGNGMIERTSPFSFIVQNNVIYYGTSIPDPSWVTVFSGYEIFYDSDVLTISNLDPGGDIDIIASATFKEYLIDIATEEEFEGETYYDSTFRALLPTSLNGYISSISLSRVNNQIIINFNDAWDETKGFDIYETPIELIITEVRRRQT